VRLTFAIPAALLTVASIHAADPLTVSRLYANQLRGPESEVVSLAEAMPAEKYGFAPTAGTFAGVRTFLQQVKHIGTTNYMVCSAVLGQKPDIDMGKNENGSDSIKTKDQAVKYLKDSFAYCHKAMDTLTAANQLDMLPSPFGQGQMARGAAAFVPVWHSFDHYGQMVEYARMNGVVPPASR
jgi:DinB superfamily